MSDSLTELARAEVGDSSAWVYANRVSGRVFVHRWPIDSPGRGSRYQVASSEVDEDGPEAACREACEKLASAGLRELPSAQPGLSLGR